MSLKHYKSTAGRYLREALLYPRVLGAKSGPRVAFCPSARREQSGLLRAYLVAEELRRIGWNAVTLPPHLNQSQRVRLLRYFAPDFVVLQKCRHRLNRSPHTDNWRIILDVDDADFHSRDMAPIMEKVARSAEGIICGSRYIERWARELNANTRVIWTGSPITKGARPLHVDREGIVAWAQSNPDDYPEEFEFVLGLMRRVAVRVPGIKLRLYGVKAVTAERLEKQLAGTGLVLDLMPFLTYEAYCRSLRDAAIGLSPIMYQSPFSRGKSFGKILGYLDAKTPVICSDEVDHALFFDAGQGIVSNDVNVWEAAICDWIAAPHLRQGIADNAFKAFEDRLSVATSSRFVDGFLRELL